MRCLIDVQASKKVLALKILHKDQILRNNAAQQIRHEVGRGHTRIIHTHAKRMADSRSLSKRLELHIQTPRPCSPPRLSCTRGSSTPTSYAATAASPTSTSVRAGFPPQFKPPSTRASHPTPSPAVCVVMDLALGGDLKSYLSTRPEGRLPEPVAALYVRQLLEALVYLEAQVRVAWAPGAGRWGPCPPAR
jgi:serine/threonine protein kinase